MAEPVADIRQAYRARWNKCLKRWEAARAEWVRVKTANLAQKEIDAANKEALVAWCEYREAEVLRVRALDDGKDYLGKGDGGALPDWDDLRGAAPDATGDLSSEEWVRKQRDEWR